MPALNLPNAEPFLWYLVGFFLALELVIIIFSYLIKAFRRRSVAEGVSLSSVNVVKQLGHPGVLQEIERLRQGGEMDEALVTELTAEDRALFEVGLIDALSKLPRQDQHRLRSVLIKHGYDEQCARRLIRGDVSDRVRASRLLDLLRPQSRSKLDGPAPTAPSEDTLLARAAKTYTGTDQNSVGE